MYKNIETFLHDYFHKEIRDSKWIYLKQLNEDLIKLNDSQLYENAKSFLKKYLLQESDYQDLSKFIQSKFLRTEQEEHNWVIPYHASLIWYKYVFKDVWWEIWNQERYSLWQQFLDEIGDKNLYSLEDDYWIMENYPLGFNFKFPLNTMSWQDFYEWNYIIATLLYETYYSYFMTWDSKSWIRYIETDGHWEVNWDSEREFDCVDYLGLDIFTPKMEEILKKLWFSIIAS